VASNPSYRASRAVARTQFKKICKAGAGGQPMGCLRPAIALLLADNMDPKSPDIILLAPEWPERALLRAQLIEEGHDVVAIDGWPIPALYRRPGMKPRVLLIDLHGLPDPRAMLDEVRSVIPADRVLVVTALGTLPKDEVRRLGFTVIERPASVGQIVTAAAALLAAQPPGNDRRSDSTTKRR
jgi:hypothetical protein